MSIQLFKNKKIEKQKISMVTCYDYSFARILSQTNIDCVLVGDSLANVIHGFDHTTHATMEMMELHTAAVKRGIGSKFIVSDMPFLSNRLGLAEGTKNAGRLINAGASSVKIECADGNLDLIKHLVDSGIPVMGHLGLTPQSVHQLGGYKVQGKSSAEFEKIKNDSLQLQQAGCFALVLECVPEKLAADITQSLQIPTIGIGAGNVTDGQVLVLQDLLGMDGTKKMKFVRRFANLEQEISKAINLFAQETSEKSFPNQQETF
jgi:3-methyl-2-oxobutanoate hydroxymethyltransferase